MTTFTPDQAQHANEVANSLFKTRRFFLPKGISFKKPLPNLSTSWFRDLYLINVKLYNNYLSVAQSAENELAIEELRLGINSPKLSDDQRRVKCSLYSGGLDIIGILPLQSIYAELPSSAIKLADKLLNQHLPKSKRDLIAPVKTRERHEEFLQYAQKVLAEKAKLEAEPNWGNKAVVTLETRFGPSSYVNDFMLGKCDGLITYPHLLSYLHYEQARAGAKPNTYHTIFGTLRSGHVCVRQDKRLKELVLDPVTQNGYDCEVTFATIL